MYSEGGACVNAAMGLGWDTVSAAYLIGGECWPSKGSRWGRRSGREKQGGEACWLQRERLRGRVAPLVMDT